MFFFFAHLDKADAYAKEGYKWSSPSSLSYYFGSGTSSYNQGVWNNAVSSWNATSTPVYFSHSEGVIELYQVNDAYTDADGNSTVYYNSSTHLITSSKSWVNSYYVYSYSSTKEQSVAAHELGHVLGLADLSSSAYALMNGYTGDRYDSYGIYKPQSDDVNGVNAIY